MESIFELENRLDISKELKKTMEQLFDDSRATLYSTNNKVYNYHTLQDAINDLVFLDWKYRDTFLTVEEFLESINIDYEDLYYTDFEIDEITFLHFIELLANMKYLLEQHPEIKLSAKTSACLNNIPLILEKMNYKLETLDDRVIITKRNADVDSVLSIVPKNIAAILLEYNDFRIQNNLAAKKKILKDIDLYIEKNIKLKSFDKELDNAIGTIVNKMGVNHPVEEEPYKSFTEKQLLEWYDKCFLMMLHAIRIPKIIDIKNERKTILSN